MNKILFSALLASSLALPLAANAATNAINEAPTQKTAPEGAVKQQQCPQHPGAQQSGPQFAGKGNHKMHLAQRLSAMETAVGIRSDQLDVWRAYTASLVDMMGEPIRKPEQMQAPEQKNDAIFGEQIADRIIKKAQAAEVFKKASAELRKKLDPEQLRRLNELSEPRQQMAPRLAPTGPKPVPAPDRRPGHPRGPGHR